MRVSLTGHAGIHLGLDHCCPLDSVEPCLGDGPWGTRVGTEGRAIRDGCQGRRDHAMVGLVCIPMYEGPYALRGDGSICTARGWTRSLGMVLGTEGRLTGDALLGMGSRHGPLGRRDGARRVRASSC